MIFLGIYVIRYIHMWGSSPQEERRGIEKNPSGTHQTLIYALLCMCCVCVDCVLCAVLVAVVLTAAAMLVAGVLQQLQVYRTDWL